MRSCTCSTARFWHKVLFDRGHVSTPEPFHRLVNQGMILGETEYTGYQDESGRWVSAPAKGEVTPVKLEEDQVVKKGDGFVLAADPSIRIEARAHKMSKSRGNVINPDESSRNMAPTAFGSTRCSWGRSKRSSPGA